MKWFFKTLDIRQQSDPEVSRNKWSPVIVQLIALVEFPSCTVRRSPGGVQSSLLDEEMELRVQRDKGSILKRRALYRARTLEIDRKFFRVFGGVLTAHTSEGNMEVRERTIWNDFRKQYPKGLVKSICDILLEVVYYLKVDCDKVNVHIINPKAATKIRVITKKQTKEIKKTEL